MDGVYLSIDGHVILEGSWSAVTIKGIQAGVFSGNTGETFTFTIAPKADRAAVERILLPVSGHRVDVVMRDDVSDLDGRAIMHEFHAGDAEFAFRMLGIFEIEAEQGVRST